MNFLKKDAFPPLLPCCVKSDKLAQYPCHNFTGCFTQNNFCCNEKKKVMNNCVVLDIDSNGIPINKKPKIISCIEPKPCCSDTLIDITKCIMPEYDNSDISGPITSNSVPVNCILPKYCCSNYTTEELENNPDCNQLDNCIKQESAIDTEIIIDESSTVSSTTETTSSQVDTSNTTIDIIDSTNSSSEITTDNVINDIENTNNSSASSEESKEDSLFVIPIDSFDDNFNLFNLKLPIEKKNKQNQSKQTIQLENIEISNNIDKVNKLLQNLSFNPTKKIILNNDKKTFQATTGQTTIINNPFKKAKNID